MNENYAYIVIYIHWRKGMFRVVSNRQAIRTVDKGIWSQSEKRAMKFFQSTQTNWLILGVSPNHYPFNAKILMGFLFLSVGLILSLMFIFLDANEFLEYSNAISVTAAIFFGIICCINIAFRMAKFFEFIESCEHVVDKSKFWFHFIDSKSSDETRIFFFLNWFQDWEIQNQTQSTQKSIKKLKNGVKLFIFSCTTSHSFHLFYPNWLRAIFSTSPPIWAAMLFSHHFLCGKLWGNQNEKMTKLPVSLFFQMSKFQGYHSIGKLRVDIWSSSFFNRWWQPIIFS